MAERHQAKPNTCSTYLPLSQYTKIVPRKSRYVKNQIVLN